jgi:hypothetical protein
LGLGWQLAMILFAVPRKKENHIGGRLSKISMSVDSYLPSNFIVNAGKCQCKRDTCSSNKRPKKVSGATDHFLNRKINGLNVADTVRPRPFCNMATYITIRDYL